MQPASCTLYLKCCQQKKIHWTDKVRKKCETPNNQQANSIFSPSLHSLNYVGATHKAAIKAYIIIPPTKVRNFSVSCLLSYSIHSYQHLNHGTDGWPRLNEAAATYILFNGHFLLRKGLTNLFYLFIYLFSTIIFTKTVSMKNSSI